MIPDSLPGHPVSIQRAAPSIIRTQPWLADLHLGLATTGQRLRNLLQTECGTIAISTRSLDRFDEKKKKGRMEVTNPSIFRNITTTTIKNPTTLNIKR